MLWTLEIMEEEEHLVAPICHCVSLVVAGVWHNFFFLQTSLKVHLEQYCRHPLCMWKHFPRVDCPGPRLVWVCYESRHVEIWGWPTSVFQASMRNGQSGPWLGMPRMSERGEMFAVGSHSTGRYLQLVEQLTRQSLGQTFNVWEMFWWSEFTRKGIWTGNEV